MILAALFLSDSFRNTIVRRQAIRRGQQELTQLSQNVELKREEINKLETHPASYENLVRKELGYLRPGEKEARFLKK